MAIISNPLPILQVPLVKKKLEMLQKQFCTEAFYKKIPEIIEQTDGDVFLKAQDSDIKYLRTLTV